jgi:hypothetical protein
MALARRQRRLAVPPLSRDLKDFLPPLHAQRRKLPPSVDFPLTRKTAFQSVMPERSMGLSVSGAVAPSAPAGAEAGLFR